MKINAALLFVTILGSHQSSVASSECSGDKIVAPCGTLANLKQNVNGSKQLGFPEIENGIIHNGVGKPIGPDEKMGPPTPLQLRQAEKLIESIRETAKREIAAGKEKEFWSKEQKAMIRRLETLRVVIQKSGNPQCKPPEPGHLLMDARYMPSTHAVYLCPNVAKLAPAAFKMLVAHEFGHVISPCAMSREFYATNASVLKRKDALKTCGIKDSSYQEIIDEMKDGKSSVFSPSDELAPTYARILQGLVSCKALRKQEEEGGFKDPVVFQAAAKCLDRTYEPVFNEFQVAVKDLVVPPVLRTDQSAKLPMKCLGVYEEHFAEAFGSKVFASMLTASKNSKDEARIGLTQMHSYACTEVGSEPSPEVKFSYPSSKSRVLIQLSEAKTHNSLGCKMPVAKICNLQGESGTNEGTVSGQLQKPMGKSPVTQ